MTTDRGVRIKGGNNLLKPLLGASAVMALGMSDCADAQNTPPDLFYANPGEIVVTARKRSESIIDVPISITAATGAQLQAQGAQNLEDYAGKVPGLGMFTRGSTSTRGAGATFGI